MANHDCTPCTISGKGLEWVFDTAYVVRWREARALNEATGNDIQDEAALRLRKLSAETKSAELDLALKMGGVAPIADMERAWAALLAELGTNLRGEFITRVTMQLVGETDATKFKRTMANELAALLAAIADGSLLTERDEEVGHACLRLRAFKNGAMSAAS